MTKGTASSPDLLPEPGMTCDGHQNAGGKCMDFPDKGTNHATTVCGWDRTIQPAVWICPNHDGNSATIYNGFKIRNMDCTKKEPQVGKETSISGYYSSQHVFKENPQDGPRSPRYGAPEFQ